MAHVRQFKQMNRELKFPRTQLGRLIRNIKRKSEDDPALREILALPKGLIEPADRYGLYAPQRQLSHYKLTLGGPETDPLHGQRSHVSPLL